MLLKLCHKSSTATVGPVGGSGTKSVGSSTRVTFSTKVDFTRPPFSYTAFLVTFLPYFCSQILDSISFLNADDIWVAQEIWFGYSFASLIGVIHAFKENITGRSLRRVGCDWRGKAFFEFGTFQLVSLSVVDPL